MREAVYIERGTRISRFFAAFGLLILVLLITAPFYGGHMACALAIPTLGLVSKANRIRPEGWLTKSILCACNTNSHSFIRESSLFAPVCATWPRASALPISRPGEGLIQRVDVCAHVLPICAGISAYTVRC